MTAAPISAAQLKRLQTLYSQFAAASAYPRTRSREERLLWASLIVGHAVASFSELTTEEAGTAIARLQRDAPQSKPKPGMDGKQARRHAKDGRWDGEEFRAAPQLASSYDLGHIEQYYHRLGWDREAFDRWLRSPRSPLGRRSQPQIIRTVAQANRVRLALKRMLQKNGLWQPSATVDDLDSAKAFSLLFDRCVV